MKVLKHRLLRSDGTAVSYVESPNQGRATIRPRWIVMHYTADGGESAVRWFQNPDADASAHLVIDREGGVNQMVALDRPAWHAGKSVWKGVSGLNSHSVGIELVNYGEMVKHPTMGWMRYWDRWLGPAVPEAEVLVQGTKRVEGRTLPRGWHRYTGAQIAAARLAARAIVAAYGIEDVVGHEDVSPGRKQDPGPAFPMREFRAEVMKKSPASDPKTGMTPLAVALVEQRWNERALVREEDVTGAAGTLLRLVGPAVSRGVPGAAELRTMLADVLGFYARAG